MSIILRAVCDTHEAEGPKIQRNAGGSSLLHPDTWSEWIVDHEFCHVRLINDDHPFRYEDV